MQHRWEVAPLDPKIVALLLFYFIIVVGAGVVLARYGLRRKQRGWTVGGLAVILLWGGSLVYVLAAYALAQGGG